MAQTAFRNEEKLGLLAALVLHGALVAVLLMQTVRSEVSVFPERMTVSLATEVGLEAAAPDPVAESRAAIAPTLSDAPAPAPQPAPNPSRPERAERVAVTPPPKPATRIATSPPAPSRDRSRPDRTPPKVATPAKSASKGGGSLIGDDFLAGSGSSTTTTETRVPASQIGASAKASLIQQISREIRPNWQPPNGADVEQLATYLRFRLNPDGSLAGRPEMVRQTGVNDLNRAQAARHAELAIRAVQRAQPFDLPEQYYEAWKVVGPLEFNWELSQ
jgi:hypothetical protein